MHDAERMIDADIRISKSPDRRGACLLTAETWLSRDRAEVFAYFSDARNLERLTPPWLNLKVLTTGPIEMRPGALIDYRLRVRFVPIRWQSEVTIWQPPEKFVDEQRRGPYRYWHHEHLFREQAGGTLAKDAVTYAAPCGWLTNRTLVARDLRRVFAYRQAKLHEIFEAS